MSEKNLSIAYNGVIYEVKAVFKVVSSSSSGQMALVVRGSGKTANEIMLVNAYQLIDGIERRDGEYIELQGPILLFSVEDWVHSFNIKGGKNESAKI